MEKRLWDIYTPTAKADAIAKGLSEQLQKIGGRVHRTTRARVNGETRLHVSLETPDGVEGIEKVYKVVKWIARQGATVTGS